MKRRKHDDENEYLLNNKQSIENSGDLTQLLPSRLETAKSSYLYPLIALSWAWIYPVLSLAHKRNLTEDDLDDVPGVDKASVLLSRLNIHKWLSATTFRIVLKEFWKEYIFANLALIPFSILCVVQPVLLHKIILAMINEDHLNNVGYICLALLFIFAFLRPFFERHAIFCATRIGVRVRVALMIMIYKASLSLKLSSNQINVAKITNLIANDTSKFEEIYHFFANVIEGLIESFGILGILCWILHPLPVLLSFFLLLAFTLVQIYFTWKFAQHREITVKYTDQRIKLSHEFINGFHSVKMNNWETAIDAQMTQIREKEVETIRRTSRLRALNTTQYFSSTPLFALFTFGTALLLGYELNAANTFPAILSFSLIRNNFLRWLQFSCEKLGEIRFASQRIDDLIRLLINQLRECPMVISTDIQHEKGTITISNASFSWNHEILCLQSLNLTIDKGTFVGIVGPVGSGKSSLLAAILGELKLIDGKINTNQSSFAYAAQSPWIFADTIRSNILLNRPFDELKYHKVIHACCLDIDFQLIGPSGDLTIVGDNGINLSGGQKVRIGLARAIYGDVDVYLLDDPFSAVDRIVAEQIYERCIGEDGVLKGKTCLLVTHQTQFVSQAKQVIFLCHGRIIEKDPSNDSAVKINSMRKEKTPALSDMLDINSLTSDTQPIIANESSTYDGSRWALWYKWLAAPPLGAFGLVLSIVLLLLGEGLFDASNFWLSKWLQRSKETEEVSSRFAFIYFGLLTATIFVDIIRTNFYFTVVMNGSNAFYNNMKTGLLYTSIQFFESNPAGRILNRLSKDQHVIDEVLPNILLTGIVVLLIACGSMLNICIFHPWMPILLFTLGVIGYFVHRFYEKAGRQLKRLESTTRSPIYALFSTSIHGLSTIRAFNAQEHFIGMMCKRIDTNTSAYLNVHAASQWFSLLLSNICLPVLLAASIDIALAHNKIEPSEVALTLTAALFLTLSFQWSIRRFVEADILMTSIERIYEYSLLPPEEDNNEKEQFLNISTEWPTHGNIQFNNYSLRHRSNLKYVIRNMNLNVTDGQKLGIIGRTGAGKSSIFKGIFRFVDRSNVDGQILIDGIDISCIKLSQLRSNLTIIPQQPILFSGTLRYNLDPCNMYSDEECWKAIEDVKLKSFVMNNSAGLLLPVAEFGNNLSVGQCQLINIARALLRRSKILLIDEATANVDLETDNLIQTIIREKFRDRTVLTIAHRLETVAKCDFIVVLDRGTVVNYDLPKNIFQIYEE